MSVYRGSVYRGGVYRKPCPQARIRRGMCLSNKNLPVLYVIIYTLYDINIRRSKGLNRLGTNGQQIQTESQSSIVMVDVVCSNTS